MNLDPNPSDIARVAKGERIFANGQNRVIEAVNRLSRGVAPPQQVFSGDKRPVPIGVRQFKLVSVQTDYLVCNEWDGTTQGDGEYKIALPWMLRQTPFDGQTRNGITYTYASASERTADDGSNTETQVIVPSYVAGDVIYGMKEIRGGTDTEDEAGDTVGWLDLNIDARAWARQTTSD